MGDFDLSFAAGAGADSLEELLRRKFIEATERRRHAIASRGLDLEAQRDSVNAELGRGTLQLGGRRTALDENKFTEDTRQFNVEQPLRARLQTAQAGDLESRPRREQDSRDHDFRLTDLRNSQELGQIDQRGKTEGQLIAQRGAQDRLTLQTRPPAASLTAADRTERKESVKEQNEAQRLVELIDQIDRDPALPQSVGALDGRGLGMVQGMDGYNRFAALHDQLVGQLQLANAGKLKGQGQVSNIEREMLKQASTALRRTLNEQDYKAELAKLRKVAETMAAGGQAGTAPPSDAANRAAELLKKYGG